MLSFDEALKKLLDAVVVTSRSMEMPVVDSANKVLAADVRALCDVPPFDNSAMDGFALRCADVVQGSALPVFQKIFAGSAPTPLLPHSAARLFTGSVLPAGADAVVLQEDCDYSDSQVLVKEMPQPGQHIRKRGEDIQCGQILLDKGVRLLPKHIAYLVSAGVQSVKVYRPLRVGVLATGDEICEPGTTLAMGQIYNSNLYLLRAELLRLGFDVAAETARDSVAVIKEAFVRLCANNDVVLSIGGVSVGEADFVKQAIADVGSLEMWKVAMKPGKPLSFGYVLDKPVLGLPGNPVSAFATFHLFARPYLQGMQGEVLAPASVESYPIVLEKPLHPKREEFLRVRLQIVDGQPCLVPYPHQGSGVLSSVVWANGFARIAMNAVTQNGDKVPYLPFMARE